MKIFIPLKMTRNINNFKLLLLIIVAIAIKNINAKDFTIYPGVCPPIDYSSVPQWIIDDTEAHNNLAKTRPLLLSYDFIVVGAGAAGSAIASRLTEDPTVTVLLIEAGGAENGTTDTPALVFHYFLNQSPSPYDWQFVTHPAVNGTFLTNFPDGNIKIQRGRALGGSSSINGMLYFRGSPQDYDNWVTLGATDWSWNDVFPYFLRLEGNKDPDIANNGYHNAYGPLPVTSNAKNSTVAQYLIDACNQLGFPTIDLNGEFRIGTNFAQQTIVNGTRVSASKAYLESVMNKRPNLHIMANSYVTKVIFSPTKRAIGVQYQRTILGFNLTFTALAKKEVILAAGVIKSPQILLLSGIGPKQNLNKFKIPIVTELKGVGQNLRDHVLTLGQNFLIPKNGSIVDTCNQYLNTRSGPLAHFDVGICAANSSLNNDIEWNDIQIAFANSTLILPTDLIEQFDSIAFLVFNVRPKSVGYLELQSTDPFDQPYIQPNYLTNNHDMKVLVDGLRWSYRIAQTNSFADFGSQAFVNLISGCEHSFSTVNDTLFPNMIVPSDQYLECVIRHLTSPGLHLVGTCAIGSERNPLSVVNPRLEVLGGVSRLRVCDSSVMPRPPNDPTYIPSVMIGEKCAQMVKNRYNLK